MEIGSKYYSGVIPTHGRGRIGATPSPEAEKCESVRAEIDHYCEWLSRAISGNEALIDSVIGILRCPQQPEVCRFEDTNEPSPHLPQVLEALIHRLENGNQRLAELKEELRTQVGEIKILRNGNQRLAELKEELRTQQVGEIKILR